MLEYSTSFGRVDPKTPNTSTKSKWQVVYNKRQRKAIAVSILLNTQKLTAIESFS